MNPEGHLDKARAFEDRANRWETDRDAPSVIEDIFDATVHYIGYAINVKFGQDLDSHGKQKRFLKEREQTEIYLVYERIEQMRIKIVYGGGWNGDTIEKGLKLLDEVKQWSQPPTGSNK